MKPAQYYVLIAIGAACLLLSIVGMAVAKSNQHLQTELQQQQEEINRGTQSQQMRNTLIRDIAQAAVDKKDNVLKEILTRAGFSLTPNAAAAPAGTSSSDAGSAPAPFSSSTSSLSHP
jgi:hypothetical protein